MLKKNLFTKNGIEKQLIYAMQSLDNINDGVFWADNDSNFVYVNEAACRELGYSKSELLKMKVTQIDASQEYKDLENYSQLVVDLKRGNITHFNTYHKHRDGHLIPVEIVTTGIGGGEVGASIVRDMTEHIRTETELKEAYNHLSFLNKIYQIYMTEMDIDSIIKDTPHLLQNELALDSIAIYLYDDIQKEIIICNSVGMEDELRKKLHTLPESFYKKAKHNFEGIEYIEATHQEILDLLQDKSYIDCVFFPIYLNKKLSGGISILNKSNQLDKSKNREIVSAVCAQISIVIHNIHLYKSLHGELESHKKTEELLKKANRELENSSNYDQLTNLWNRRCFLNHININEQIKNLKKKNFHITLFLLDIDNFKYVNDRFGHQAGDSVLVEFAGLLKNNIRSGDSLTRWGGEEFLLLAPNLDSENAIYYAERIRNLVANYTFSAIKTITVSIGVAELQECEDLEHWIKRVDDALYSAKKNRNEVALSVS